MSCQNLFILLLLIGSITLPQYVSGVINTNNGNGNDKTTSEVASQESFILRQDLFDDTVVHKLEITTVSKTAWEDALSDATERCTQRAIRSEAKDWRTSPFYLACEELEMTEPCTVTIGSKFFSGICADAFFESVKLCTPQEAVMASVACRSLTLNKPCEVHYSDGVVDRIKTKGVCSKDGIGENLVCLTENFLDFINYLTRTAYWEPFNLANITYSLNPQSPVDTRSFVSVRLDGRASLCAPLLNELKQVPLLLDFSNAVSQEILSAKKQPTKLANILRTRPLTSFHGQWQLILRGGAWDISRIRGKLLSDAFRAFGVRAPRYSHATVYINKQYYGVYSVTEETRGIPIRTPMNWPPGEDIAGLPAFSGANRQLFEDIDDCDAQRQLEADLHELYDVKNNTFKVSEIVAPSYEPLSKLETLHIHTFHPMIRNISKVDFRKDATEFFTILHSDLRFTNPTQWRRDLQQVFQVDSFLRWLAVNYLFENYDAYGLIPHNFRFYKSPCSGKFHFIPYDFDWSMQPKSASIGLDMASMNEDWPLISNIIADPTYYAYYLKVLQLLVEEYFTVEYMEARVQRLNQQIKSYVLQETVDICATDEEQFKASTDAILDYVKSRRADAMQQIDRMVRSFKDKQSKNVARSSKFNDEL